MTVFPRVIGLGLTLAAGMGELARAQAISGVASRWLTSRVVWDYRISVSRYGAGPIALLPFAQLAFQGPKSDDAALAGVGADVLARITGDARPYAIASVSGGFIDLRGNVGVKLWSSWSVGGGIELVRLAGVGVAAEARYQSLSRGTTHGVSLGLRLGSAVGSGRRSEPTPPEPERPAEPRAPGSAREAAARRATEIALAAMGTPYRWGGSDGNGFDCSGLIRYAYGQVGIELPRRSADQALEGRAVERARDALRPGDILTFSQSSGAEVTHVGLYLGESRFIHSASGGVRTSVLSDADPDGRWWLDRWVGARRVIE